MVNWQDRHNPHSGGAEIHLHEVFGRLAARGHEVTLLVSSWQGAAARTVVDGMDVHRTGGRHTFPIMAPVYHRRHLAQRSFDIVIEDLNKVPVLAPRWRRTPAVLLVHHLFGATAFEEAAFPVAAATWLMEQPLARLYRGLPVQAVSESTAQDLVRRGFERSRIEVIENGVDLHYYSTSPETTRFAEPTVLYLGRLKRYKRVDLIVRAIARLRADGVEARLIIAGQGDARRDLERLTAELDLTDRIRFAGFVSEDEKRELFRRTWVHALTSPKEGWGISNVEAAACGTATVASDSPGLRDSVRDGVTGFLAPHGDVDALAGRLARILRDPALRDELGAQARAFAEQFSWDRTADRTETHLSRVLVDG
ncbi:MAG TPA: glycosyltransferase family 4 protein [Longimicrobiales bacterium]|nr:glycosyltransferase family 4 protein [Longimicrobiales bacterium]